MKLDLGKYQIVSDDLQFIVQEKKIVQASKLTKEENIGKEYWKDSAYCGDIEQALKYISKKITLRNDAIEDVIKELKELGDTIKEFSSKFEIKI